MDAGTPNTISATIIRTADTAALCKWSLTRHGYLASAFPQLPPETLSLLASLAGADPSSPPSYRASPLLHWCYALRAKAVLSQVLSFLEKGEGGKEGGKRRKVVVLGGGMDGLVLGLCAGVNMEDEIKLVEIDVPEVVARKEAALQAWREGGKEGGKEGVVGTFLKGKGSYTLKAADLRDVESMRKALREVEEEEEEGEEGREEEVLFIFEAVLGYMKPKEVERLLRFLPTTSSSCSLLIIDTGRVAGLKGKDAVAAAVGASFAKKGCPLEGLGRWKSRQNVQRDLRAWGWNGNIAAQTLWEATHEQREGEGEGGREGEVEEEVFDEYAAWHLFAQQSWCIHAFSSFPLPPSLPPSLPLSIRPYRPHTTDHAVVMALIEEGREGAKEGRPAVASFVAKTLKKDMKSLEEGAYPGEFWVAEEEGEGGREGGLAVVVGCVGLRVSGKKEGGREGEVVRLSVRKDRRSRGVGLRLLTFVEEVARTWVDGEGGGKEEGGGGGEGGGGSPQVNGKKNGGERGIEKREEDAVQIEEGQSGLRRLRATTLGEDALPGALALYVERAGWVVERQSTYGGGKGGGGEGLLYHLYKDIKSK